MTAPNTETSIAKRRARASASPAGSQCRVGILRSAHRGLRDKLAFAMCARWSGEHAPSMSVGFIDGAAAIARVRPSIRNFLELDLILRPKEEHHLRVADLSEMPRPLPLLRRPLGMGKR